MAATRTTDYTVDLSKCRITQQVIEPNVPALKVTTTLGFDVCGNVNSIQIVGAKPDGSAMPARTTTADYDDYTTRCQLPEKITDALNKSTTFIYDYSFGVPTRLTDPNGLATNWGHDDFGRRTSETRPDSTSTAWTFASCSVGPCWGVNDLRFLVYETERNATGGHIRLRELFYDGVDRLRYDESEHFLDTWTIDRIIVYDSLGRPTHDYQPLFVSGGNGYRNFVYDPLNRVTAERLYQSSGALDRTTSYVYAGRTVTMTDPLLRAHTQVRDVAGRLRRVTDPSPGGTTEYDYDSFGNLNRIEDPIGAVSTAAYNLRGFRTQWTDADQNGSWTLIGNSLNERVSWTDPKGSSFSAAYDALGRMTTRTLPEFTATWTWGNSAAAHNIGRLASVSGPATSESRTYDSLGRLKTRVINTDQTYQYDYTYNTIGALDTITYPTSPVPANQTGSRFKIQYAYDHGVPYRIQDITQSPASTLWTLTEATPSSLPKKEMLGASLIAVENGYTPWTDELTSAKAGIGGSTTNRQNLSYTWDDVGFLGQRQDLNQNLTEIFTPDPLDRVTAATLNGAPTLSVSYDESGNILSKNGATYVYGNASRPHRVTAAGTDTFTHDDNGNMVTRNGLTQTWTSDNLPKTLRGATYQSTFTYGPERDRWEQVSTYSNGTETTHYVGALLEKAHATSTGLTYWRHYVPTPSGLTILVSRNSNNTTTKTYMLADHLGSSDALLDEGGNYRVRESFDAFGTRRGSNWSASTAPDWTAIGNTSRRGFTFHEAIDNIGLVHMNGRVYDPKLGRFLSIDPLIGDLSDSQSVNPYAYVGNRPLSYVDPSGLDAVGCLATQPCQAIVVGVLTTIGNFLFGGSGPPPPPATALPGVSAQNGVGMCGPGTLSPICGGGVLYMGVPQVPQGETPFVRGVDDFFEGYFRRVVDDTYEMILISAAQDLANHGDFASATVLMATVEAEGPLLGPVDSPEGEFGYDLGAMGLPTPAIGTAAILARGATTAKAGVQAARAAARGIPRIRVSRGRFPESAQHIDDAVAAGQPATLTIGRAGAAARRREALRGTQPRAGLDRDEFPPALFREGGEGASVRPIGRADNRGAGGCIGAQCRTLPDGTRIVIETVD